MQETIPVINLEGYERLRHLEHGLTWSPVSVALSLVAWAGLLLTGVCGFALFISLSQGPNETWAIAVAGAAVVSAAAVGLERAYTFYRLARLPCPRCDRILSRYVADLEKAEWGRWGGIRRVWLDGHLYSAPFIGDVEDRRQRVRLMKEVRACASCRTYVDCREPHERTCSGEELERLREHGSSGTRGDSA
jgi:hypothetical protein